MKENDFSLPELLKMPVSWLEPSGPDDDIALSTRIRLARNLEGTPFPVLHNEDALFHVQELCLNAIQETESFVSPLKISYAELNPDGRSFLCERRQISRDFLNASRESALVAESDGSVSIMINEEDHLRMQVLLPGARFADAWKQMDSLDDRLSSRLPFAFDSGLGYLTSSPANLGTGMKASVLLHLPGLVLTEQIRAVSAGLSKLGINVLPFFEDGSSTTTGNLFVISNQSTLGESEEQILDRLIALTEQLVSHEKRARLSMMSGKRNFLMDFCGRAYGRLRYSYYMPCKEAVDSLSALRLGADLGMFSSVDISTVNSLLMLVQPAHLAIRAGSDLNKSQRCEYRAELLRTTLKDLKDRL